MNGPRDYPAFLQLLGVLVPVDLQALRSDRSVGGYLALQVAADQFLHNGKQAFDIDFYRDEGAEGGVSTRLMDEPSTDIAPSWQVGAYAKLTLERFLSHGVLDLHRIQTAMAHDQLLRVAQGQKIELERASLNAISMLRGTIPARRRELGGPSPEIDIQALGADL